MPLNFWLKQVLIALDQLINALLGGWADETLSSHAYRLDQDGKPFGFMRRVIDLVLWFDPDHCKQSYLSETLRMQSPPQARPQ